MDRPSNSNARLLAPVALVAAFLVFVIVIASSTGGGGGGGGGPANSQQDTTKSSSKDRGSTNGATATKDTTYIVKPGDSLTSIAKRTRIPVNRLIELNPDVDPQALISGQCIALTAPSECK
jgi:LysM repeat protein